MIRTLIPYGKRTLSLSFDDALSVELCDIATARPIEERVGEIRNALLNPIGTTRLSGIATGKRTAAIAISDFSRPTLDREIIPIVLDELNRGGIRDSNIIVIIGGGLHKHMTLKEVQRKVGASVLRRVRVLQHDPERNLVLVGTSKFGNQIWINRTMTSADVKVAIGDIVPHPYTGFSGGGKATMPGLGGRETIIRNHLMVKAELNIGQMENNPVREEIDEAARMLHLDFMVNTVQNVTGGLVKVVAGDPIDAHRVGARVCAEVYSVKVESRPDLIVASAFPYDRDFYYCSKPLENVRGIVKEGSTVVLVSPCRGGIGCRDLDYFLSQPTPEAILDSMKRNPNRNLVTALVAYQVALVRERAEIVAHTQGLKPRVLRRIGLKQSTNLQETVNNAISSHGSDCKILVLPHASTAMPQLATA